MEQDMIKVALGVVVASVLMAGAAQAAVCTSYPYSPTTTPALANGQTADASLIWSDFNCAALTGGSPGPFTVGTGVSYAVTPAPGDVLAGGSAGFMQIKAAGPSLYMQRSSTDGLGYTTNLRKSRGTAASPLVINSGDVLSSFRSSGWDGTAFVEADRINFSSQGTISTGVVPGLIDFYAADSMGSLTRIVSIDATGVIDRVGQIQGVSAATAAAPAFAFASDLTTGVFRPSSHVLGFSTNAVEAARFDSSGNLLIASTTQPGGLKLYVNGNAGITGSLTLAGATSVDSTGGVHLTNTTVAALPTCSSTAKGTLYEVTDANAPTWNGALAGGGSVVVGARCNGSNWVAW